MGSPSSTMFDFRYANLLFLKSGVRFTSDVTSFRKSSTFNLFFFDKGELGLCAAFGLRWFWTGRSGFLSLNHERC